MKASSRPAPARRIVKLRSAHSAPNTGLYWFAAFCLLVGSLAHTLPGSSSGVAPGTG